MKKKKILTPGKNSATTADTAALEKKITEALEFIAFKLTENEWYELLLDLGERRFKVNTFLTIHHKKIAFEEFAKNTPYANIITKPQVCKRTIGRYKLEYKASLLMTFLTWTIMAKVSAQMFFISIFFGL